jgi:integral membrane protein
MSPRRLFRAVAIAEAVTWTLLLAGMFLKYVTDTTELGVRVGGGLHGFAFLTYCVATVLVAIDRGWTPGRLAAGLAAAFVPYATVPFERSVDRAGLLPDSWRLRTERPASFPERPVALALRSPGLAGVLTLVVLAAVFGGLLALGPPTTWGS